MEALEALIDELNANQSGRSPTSSPCRWIARRGATPRRANRLPASRARDRYVSTATRRSASTVLPYLNRLSDALFVMARYENHERGVPSRSGDPASRRGSGRASRASRIGATSADPKVRSGENGARNVKAAGVGPSRRIVEPRRASLERWDVTGRQPPQYEMRLGQLLEPGTTLPKDLDVRTRVGERS